MFFKDVVKFNHTEETSAAPQQCRWALQMRQAGCIGHNIRLRVASVTTYMQAFNMHSVQCDSDAAPAEGRQTEQDGSGK